MNLGGVAVNFPGVAVNSWGVAMNSWGVAVKSWGVAVNSWGVAVKSWGVAVNSWGVAVISWGVAVNSWGVAVNFWGVAVSFWGVAVTSGGGCCEILGGFLEAPGKHYNAIQCTASANLWHLTCRRCATQRDSIGIEHTLSLSLVTQSQYMLMNTKGISFRPENPLDVQNNAARAQCSKRKLLPKMQGSEEHIEYHMHSTIVVQLYIAKKKCRTYDVHAAVCHHLLLVIVQEPLQLNS